MSTRGRILAAAAVAAFVAWSPPLGLAQSGQSFTTLVTTPLPIEGLTGDGVFLYTVGRGSDSCPVWRINLSTPSLEVVGVIPAPCSPSGVALHGGDVLAADGELRRQPPRQQPQHRRRGPAHGEHPRQDLLRRPVMKRLALALLLIPAGAAASDDPRLELAAGYSYLRSDDRNRHGWIGSAALNLSERFGVEAELAGHYTSADGVALRAHSFLAGPCFVPFRRMLTPFVHVLAGAVRTSQGFDLLGVSVSESKSHLGGVAGAGMDYRINDLLGVRVQADLRLVRLDGKTEYDPRASACLVLRIGDR